MPYLTVNFLQGDDAVEALKILDEHGEIAVMSYLWDTQPEEFLSTSDSPPWGEGDTVSHSSNVTLSYNLRLGYVGLSLYSETKF